jgi:multiple sugar transport system ATP-binding protein
MADKIAVMNLGVVEQYGTPQEVYDRPATMFVADFVGSPPMNFLRFSSALTPGDETVRLNGARVPVPRIAEGRAEGDLVLGVRPEHIRFADSSDLRARIFGTEYLGTTQIVTLDTQHGQVKARIPADAVARAGETVGLSFRTPQISLFDAATGRAIRNPGEQAYV